MRKITYGIIHHSASGSITLDEMRQEHIQQGYSDIAYNWIIGSNGAVYPGRPESVKSAAQYGINDIAVAVCLLGYFHDDSLGKKINMLIPTDAQLNSLYKVIDGWKQRYPGITIARHRDVKDIANKVLKLGIPESQMSTACPGNLFPSDKVKAALVAKDIKVYWK